MNSGESCATLTPSQCGGTSIGVSDWPCWGGTKRQRGVAPRPHPRRRVRARRLLDRRRRSGRHGPHDRDAARGPLLSTSSTPARGSRVGTLAPWSSSTCLPGRRRSSMPARTAMPLPASWRTSAATSVAWWARRWQSTPYQPAETEARIASLLAEHAAKPGAGDGPRAAVAASLDGRVRDRRNGPRERRVRPPVQPAGERAGHRHPVGRRCGLPRAHEEPGDDGAEAGRDLRAPPG